MKIFSFYENLQIFSLRCGNCMLVISRRYACGAIFIFVCLFLLFKPSFHTPEALKKRSIIPSSPLFFSFNLNFLVNDGELKWENFAHDCGRRVYLDNAVRAKRLYNLQYHNKVVNWFGIFMEMKHFRDKSVMFIKMNPSDSS